MAIEPREFMDREGRSPFALWFDALDAIAAAKVSTALIDPAGARQRLNIESIGGGCSN
jgi:hypothetical protein